MTTTDRPPWWQGAVIYQIYPRSFFDTNGDGIGDLPGIECRLDYVASLGVDAIWLSPIQPSPNRDFGYDIADYRNIALEMGTLADFDRLIAAAHRRGLRVILDQVWSHTSDQHPWFLESACSRDNPKADWYVWHDAREDGTAPNNWMSSFGGPAWSWWPQRRQYYHHKFLKQQPKLNLHHPAVVREIVGVLRFWLERGVDGFRLDVAQSYLHDPQLRDNPPLPMEERGPMQWMHAPRLQRHCYDANLPESSAFISQLRTAANDYGDDILLLGEFSEQQSMLGICTGPRGLHTGYTFDFLRDSSLSPHIFRDYYEKILAPYESLWPCVTFSNHDAPRPVTRWGGADVDDDLAKLALTLLLALKGTVLLYQGEELGLPDAELERAALRDPCGDLYYPVYKGRDGVRTPFPWRSDAPAAGFSSGVPWLPVPDNHLLRALSVQKSDPNSVYTHALCAIRARKQCPALACGTIRFHEAPAPLLVFARQYGPECVICVFNLGRNTASMPWRHPEAAPLDLAHGNNRLEGGTLELAPLSAFLARI